MPYKLSGTSVVKADTGEVVKKHPTREKALRHLRALKANVEESSAVSYRWVEHEGQRRLARVLPHGYELTEVLWDPDKHPRGRGGKWIDVLDKLTKKVEGGPAHVVQAIVADRLRERHDRRHPPPAPPPGPAILKVPSSAWYGLDKPRPYSGS